MSKVVRVYRHRGPEELRTEDLDIGEPGPGEVRLRVEAIGLNRSEALFRAGMYPVASSIWADPGRFSRNRDLILRGLASGHLKPIIAKTFPFSQIIAAHRYLESNQQVGKVVVTV
jgi:NADPH:quinone reductase-like Zn-dependent oxidoreductase